LSETDVTALPSKINSLGLDDSWKLALMPLRALLHDRTEGTIHVVSELAKVGRGFVFSFAVETLAPPRRDSAQEVTTPLRAP
jgi:hypothetical protein